MKKDPKDNNLSLSVEDIGSEIEDAKVTCIKVLCPRKANNFVSFLCDGRFTVAGKSKVDIVEGGSYIISGKVTEWNNRPQVTLDVDYENGMGVSVGRIREDSVYDWKFVGLSHNTVRGAAGGAVLCAELLKDMGYITKK